MEIDKEEENYEDWIEQQGYIRSRYREFYECPGCHLWHEDEVYKLYKESLIKEAKND
tara:strand:- start:244 stop:414 length:171 start_codon:yes stop_codon:yes gene_type:complete